ncbi:Protein kinase domain-containing protein [Psidium guajava]|nr:Protein kinase domain-containing protein [Psidium guajava]
MKIGGQKQNSYSQPPANDSHGCPWLLILHGSDGHRQTFCNITEDRYYTRKIPDMLNQRTHLTSLEWMVLEDCDSEECCLWNPSSMEKFQLPCARGVAPDRCFLSSSPRDPHCTVFLIDIYESIVWFCGLGDDAFREQKVEHEDGGRLASAALYKGEMHLLTWKCNLVRLDLVGSELRWTQFTSPDFSHLLPTWVHACRHFLVPTGDELLLVRATYTGGGIAFSNLTGFLVLRMNFDNHRWEKLSNIGAWTIFISDSNCFSEDCGGKLKRNCIYYAMSGDRRLYLYDLEDQSISMSLPCPIAHRRTVLEWIMM